MRFIGPKSLSIAALAIALLALSTAATASDFDGLGEKSREKLRSLNEIIVKNPRSADAYIDRAIFYSAAMMEEEATKDFDHAISLDPKNFKAYQERGIAHMRQEEFKPAVSDFMKAGALAPAGLKGPSYRNAGRALLKLRANSEAVKALTTAIACETPYAKHLSLKERAQAYLNLGKYKEAIADVQTIEATHINHKLNDARALTIRAEAEMHLGQYEKAIADLSQALRRNRRSDASFETAVFTDGTTRLYQLRSECYSKLGNSDLARKDLKKSKTAENDSLKYAPFR